MKFPGFVYRCPGAHHCEGNTYDYRPVSDEAALKAALADGWFDTLPAAIEGKVKKPTAPPPPPPAAPVPDDNAAPTRAELETKAKELGISFNARTADETLLARIDEALEA